MGGRREHEKIIKRRLEIKTRKGEIF
jgi:hypothetical protein